MRTAFCVILHCAEKAFELIKGDDICVVIQIGMHSAFDDHQFFIVGVLAVLDHVGIGLFGEVAGMCLFAMHDQYGAADLIAVAQDRLIHEGFTADDIPAIVGIE